MPQNFIGFDRDQELLLPPDLRDWLPQDHLAWFVLAAVEEVDLYAFYRPYNADGAQMEHITGQGIPVLVPPDADKRKGTRPGWDGGLYALMRAVLETELGKTLYRKRQETVEPVFAHTKFNRRFDRFQRRGRAACHSEWRLINATHNLLKLHTALQAA